MPKPETLPYRLFQNNTKTYKPHRSRTNLLRTGRISGLALGTSELETKVTESLPFRQPNSLLENGLLYLFSQETPSISMLWERERDWDWVSRLLEGELLRELTPSLLWLRCATPGRKRQEKLSFPRSNIRAICNGASKPTQSARLPSRRSADKESPSGDHAQCLILKSRKH